MPRRAKVNFNFSLKGKLDATEKWLLRGAAGVLMLTILYSGFSLYLDNKINEKISETEEILFSYNQENNWSAWNLRDPCETKYSSISSLVKLYIFIIPPQYLYYTTKEKKKHLLQKQ